MTITVLYAPDGPRIWAPGRIQLNLLLKEYWLCSGAGTSLCLDDDDRLMPGHRLEHHNLAELLARPTAKELQAAKAADHASTLEAYKLGSTIQESKIARLEAEIADLRRLVEAAYTEGWEHAAFAEENNAKWMWQTSEAAKALTVKP